MPWMIRLIEDPAIKRVNRELRVGDMWLETEFFEHGPMKLSPKYHADWKATRLPLMVRLPGNVDFCVDVCAWRNGVAVGDGWTVTGEAPLITMSPSVNIGGIYHGFIQNGVISDDCEGRRYRDDGSLVRGQA